MATDIQYGVHYFYFQTYDKKRGERTKAMTDEQLWGSINETVKKNKWTIVNFETITTKPGYRFATGGYKVFYKKQIPRLKNE